MDLITDPMKKVIRHGLVLKYIQRSGITLPKLPQIPNFEMPPMPDMKMLEDQINQLKTAMNTNANTSLYTDEYLAALKKYDELVKKCTEKYNAEIEELDESEEDINNVSSEKIVENAVKRKKIENEYKESLKKAKKDSGIGEVKKKFKSIKSDEKEKAKEDAEKANEAKKAKAKSEALEYLKTGMLKTYYDYVKKETAKITKFAMDIKAMYDDSVKLYKKVVSKAKEFYNSDSGKQFVDAECDKINRAWNDITESFKELIYNITAMVAKIPNPDVIVAGAATGVPNPGQKIMVFMQDFKKVMKNITQIKNSIQTIIAILMTLATAFEQIKALVDMIEKLKKQEEDADKNFKKAVKEARKRSKWFLEHEKPENEEEKKLAGYMYADLTVDYTNYDISVNGYKCYCKKGYGRTYLEDGKIKHSRWIGGYEKNGGNRVDASGKRYYYLPADKVYDSGKYDESELKEILEADGEDISEYDTGGTEYDVETGTTKLNLSDGRTVVIDYLASVGDTIRLDDGTVLKVVG